MLPPVAPATVVEACVWDLRVGDKGVPAGLVLSRCASAAGGRELQQPLWAGGDTVTLGTWSKNSTPTVRLPPWTSPSTPGAYVATWVLTTSDGVRCGPLLQLAVDVSEDAVAQFVVDGDRQVCTAFLERTRGSGIGCMRGSSCPYVHSACRQSQPAPAPPPRAMTPGHVAAVAAAAAAATEALAAVVATSRAIAGLPARQNFFAARRTQAPVVATAAVDAHRPLQSREVKCADGRLEVMHWQTRTIYTR